MFYKLTPSEKKLSKILRESQIQNFFNNFETGFTIAPEELNSKIKFDTGKFCNARCNFCYYLDSVSKDDRISLETVKKMKLDILSKITHIEFSGGEPTLVKDLPQIMEYLSHQRYLLTGKINLKFGIVTNGWKLKEFINTLKEQYYYQLLNLDSILISLHGNKQTHENITKIKNSYDKIIIAINYIKRNFPNIKIRINVVLIGQEIAPEFINLLKDFLDKDIQINLLPSNFWDDASKNLKMIGNTSHVIYETIENLLNAFYSEELLERNIEYQRENGANILNIRYVKLCHIQEKFHQFCVNHYQHFFDKLDWNKFWYPEYKDGINIYKDIDISINLIENLQKVFLQDAEQSHFIDTICKKCSKFKNLECDGQKIINQKDNIIFEDPASKQIRLEYIKGNR